MLFGISKSTSQKLPIQSMLMTGVISGVVTLKDKTKSNPLVNQKVRSITKSVVSFKSFPVSLRGPFVPLKLPALKHVTIINRGNKSASSNDKLDLIV